MGPLTRGDRCATGGLPEPERAKPMSLAMEGMGDMEGIGDMRRSAKDGKHCSEYASDGMAKRSFGVLMDLNLALADAVEAMYPGYAIAGEHGCSPSSTSDALPGVRLVRTKERLDEYPSRLS